MRRPSPGLTTAGMSGAMPYPIGTASAAPTPPALFRGRK